MAVGMLEFDGEKVDVGSKPYQELIAPYRGKGKNKRALVKNLRFKPLKVVGDARQGYITTAGGTKQVQPQDVVSFPIWDDKKGDWIRKEGTLRYFTSKQPTGQQGQYTYKPTRIPFNNGMLEVPSNDDALLLYFICHSKNTQNHLRTEKDEKTGRDKEVGWSTKPGEFEISMPLAASKKLGVQLDEKLDAMTRVKTALAVNLPLARQLYETCGYTDWDVYENGKKMDLTEIRAVLMNKADKEPGKVIELLSDTALDITSKIVQALTLGVLLQEGSSFYWGPTADNGKYKNVPAKEKEIVSVPRGKAPNKEALLSWFCEYLKGEPEVMSEINTELDVLKLQAA